MDETADQPALTPRDVPAILREEYLYAIEMARAQHDPDADWEGFRDHLWEALVRVFGVEASDSLM